MADTNQVTETPNPVLSPVRSDCHDMAALGLTIDANGTLTMTGTREQVRAATVEAMRSCAELFQSNAPMEDAQGNPTALLQARREHLGVPDAPATFFNVDWRREHDPVRIALLEAKQLFTTIAEEIFRPDPPSQGVHNLPRSTFVDVEYFFDLAELANSAGYDLRVIGNAGVDGESNERARELNRRAFGAGAFGDGNRTTDDDDLRRKPPHQEAGTTQQLDGALAAVQSQVGQTG